MKKYKYVIIGGGTTAGYAAREMTEKGIETNELCIISDEYILPMDRPPLSKDFITYENKDAGDIEINDQKFYQQNGIVVLPNTTATSIDFNSKVITMNNDVEVEYEKLLIATGCRLNFLNVKGSELCNIFYLRTIDHAKKIRDAAKEAKNAVVVGGQYIGTEIAASLTQRGVKVTMVFPEDRLLSKFVSDEISAFFKEYYRKKGVEMIPNDKVVEFRGDKEVEQVVLRSGKTIDTNMVVAGIGVLPNIELFENTKLVLDDGIRVNEHLETDVPDVFAAGDVARFRDKTFNKLRRVEHWENAFEQGAHAARAIMGNKEPYQFLPFFFSDVFDLSYEYFGDKEGAEKYFNRGDVTSGNFSTWWLKGDTPVAAFIMSSRQEEEGKMAREWILGKKSLNNPEMLTDENISLKEINAK